MSLLKKKVRKAVIPAAGLGTRFLPITKSIPKEMVPIVDKPSIQFIVEEAIAEYCGQIEPLVGSLEPASAGNRASECGEKATDLLMISGQTFISLKHCL